MPAGDCHRIAGKKIAGKYDGKKCNNCWRPARGQNFAHFWPESSGCEFTFAAICRLATGIDHIDVVVTREPGGTDIGEEIRHLLMLCIKLMVYPVQP